MGREIDRMEFTEQGYALFRAQLLDCLRVLEKVVATPGFGAAPATVGAELEVYLVAERGRPASVNEAVCKILNDDRVALEVSRTNLEMNLTPVELTGRPFTTMAAETEQVLARITTISLPRYGARPVPIGTLPTLTPSDVGEDALTDAPRYHALERAWDQRRPRPFTLQVGEGRAGLIQAQSVALQGAACSYQVHLTVPPERFCSTFNAAQLATAPALAAAVNSPWLLGRRVWQESRIPLFERGFGDQRGVNDRARVGFGRRWLSGGPLAAFKESVHGHDVLMPAVFPAGAGALAEREFPALEELQTHLSTVWSWNRPVYDAGGHLRIEFRALPAGPTPIDMAANSAFLIGLTLSLATGGKDVAEDLPFRYARENFYRAAKEGLDAHLWWPSSTPGAAPRQLSAPDLVRELLPAAQAGLESAGVCPEEVRALLDLLDQRVTTGRTGAWWQTQAHRALSGSTGDDIQAVPAAPAEGSCAPHRPDREGHPAQDVTTPPAHVRSTPRDSADTLAADLTDRYITLCTRGAPVHTWALPSHPHGVSDEPEHPPAGQ
ncbi:glutamate-cysteine ligase family protein [Streptomyces cyaneofuscatus]|uniref:glutamate-cysteine ligase family protein n=1 Tax=Streptomyces cyaneofuscatus TaxID=66883 RepID=UPI00365268DA